MIRKIQSSLSFKRLKFLKGGLTPHYTKKTLNYIIHNDKDKKEAVAEGLALLHYGTGKNKIEFNAVTWNTGDSDFNVFYKNNRIANIHIDNVPEVTPVGIRNIFDNLALATFKNMAKYNAKNDRHPVGSTDMTESILNRYI